MADKKKGKGGSMFPKLVLLLIVVTVGAGALGYFRPDTPVVGPLVGDLLESVASGQDQSGVYKVTIDKVVLDPQEFDKGATVDIQVIVKKVKKDGDESYVWESNDYGDNLRVVGEDSLSANMSETPFEVSWRSGDQLIVEVWDYKGMHERVARFASEPDSQEFPLKATRKLTLLDGDREIAERKGGTNQIVFTHERAGDIGAENAGE